VGAGVLRRSLARHPRRVPAAHEFDEAFERAEAAHDENDPDGRFWQVDIVAADDTI
jgi:hypothetical protein